MDLESITDELYELAPADFTAVRNERAAAARKAGDRELAAQIKALRRPTLSAWASNLLVRRQPEQVQPLIGLGESMRQAHRDLDGEQLRELGWQQHELVGALARQAKQLAADAGQAVSEDVQHEVEATLHAVLADPEAAQEWAAGRLAKPIVPPVGFTAATTPDTVPRKAPRLAPVTPAGPSKEERAQLARAEKEATEAEEQALARQEEVARAESGLKEAEDDLAALAEQVKQAKQRRAHARDRLAEAKARAREANTAARKARRRAEDAAARVDRPAADR